MDKTILWKGWKKTNSVLPWSNRPERDSDATVDSVATNAGGVQARVSPTSRY